MGLADNLVRWILSFILNQKVCIAFDEYTHENLNKLNWEVPQGSPISPILAELFTAAALDLFP